MDYIVMTKEATPPFQRFDTYGDAVKHALSLGSAGSTIWQKTGETVLDVQQCDLLPDVPEPPRRGRPRKVEKRPEYPDAFGCLKPPKKPATSAGIIFDSTPYHDNERPATPAPLLIDSYGCAKDPDGVYRACIVYTRDGVTGSAIGRHEVDEPSAAMIALANMDLMFMQDLEALPDTEGKRQVLVAVGATRSPTPDELQQKLMIG